MFNVSAANDYERGYDVCHPPKACGSVRVLWSWYVWSVSVGVIRYRFGVSV